MRLRFPLYGKVLFWFFVNLALVALLAGVFIAMQFRLGLDWLLAGEARQRLEAMGEVIGGELRDQPKMVWDKVLARYQTAHGASFTIFRNDGRQTAGETLLPPREVLEKLRDRRGPPQARPQDHDDRPPREERPRDAKRAGEPPPARSDFMLRAGTPARYWVGIHIGLTDTSPPDPRPVTLLVMSDRITGGGCGCAGGPRRSRSFSITSGGGGSGSPAACRPSLRKMVKLTHAPSGSARALPPTLPLADRATRRQ